MILQLPITAILSREVTKHRHQVELRQAPVIDVADVGTNLLGAHTFNIAKRECEFDEAFFESDHRSCNIDDAIAHSGGYGTGLVMPLVK